jgi:hypothetical protein
MEGPRPPERRAPSRPEPEYDDPEPDYQEPEEEYAEPEPQAYAYKSQTAEEEEPVEEEIEEDSTLPCPACGEPLEEGARFCDECGTYLG